MFKPQYFDLEKKVQTDDGIGSFNEQWKRTAVMSGYLDLVTGTNQSTIQNAFIESSTHVFILPNIPDDLDITDQMRIVDSQGRWYSVTHVDNVMGQHHHLEVYVTFGGE